jgi:ribosome biogenesis GTPase
MSRETLESWGWSPALQASFEGIGTPHLAPSRVVRQNKTGYLVVHAGGEAFARLGGSARRRRDEKAWPAGHAGLPRPLREDPPAVGDWVALDPQDPPTIRTLLPRRTAFTRQAAGREARAQVVAANVDILYVVAGLDGDLNLRRLERYLAVGATSGARVVVVLNKADLAAPDDPRIAEVRAIASEVVLVSAATGAGVEVLRPARGETAAFVGSSGVGKSSLINRLLGEEALPTQRLRAKDGRGKHTTTARHLLQVPGGGVVLDTPGMREFALWDAEEGVAAVFDDVTALAQSCKFSDCAHESEPGCAVRDAVSPERLASWRKLRREAAASALRADVAASRAAARAWGKMARDTVRAKEERLR